MNEVLELRVFSPEIHRGKGEAEWVKVAHESHPSFGSDDESDIYFFVENDFDLGAVKVGDTIVLDESFEVLEVGGLNSC